MRVFAVVAALNAAGFDVELAPQYHPVRQRVRDALAGIDADLIRRLREFYTEHKGDALDETQLAGYISLALNLTDPPSLEFSYDQELVPPDARGLGEFLPLLREFYDAARITQLWVTLGSISTKRSIEWRLLCGKRFFRPMPISGCLWVSLA